MMSPSSLSSTKARLFISLSVVLFLTLGALPLVSATNQPAVATLPPPAAQSTPAAPVTTPPSVTPKVITAPSPASSATTTNSSTAATAPTAPTASTATKSSNSSLTAAPSPSSTPAGAETSTPSLIPRDLPEIRAKIALPKEWSLLPGKLLEGDVLLATREKIATENDPWSTGLSMTIDRNGPKDSGQKASAYALALAQEAREKAGEEASPLVESQSGPFHDIRFDFPLATEPPLVVTEILRANDTTGTLAVIIWQMPKEESLKLQPLRDAIISGLVLHPSQ